MSNALIIGGSDAGISAALRIRELAPKTAVTVMLADNYPNFSICGLPFYLSGEVPNWRNLAHRTQDDLSQQGIHLLTNHRATAINPDLRQVTAISSDKAEVLVPYDKLIIGTGATSRIPQNEAKAAGYHPVTVDFETWNHKVYYPNAHPLKFRVTGDAHTGQLLGAQVLGHYQGEVAKRVDIFATALYHGMTVEQVSDFDLSYTSPLSSPWDPVQMASQAWVRQTQRQPAMAQG